MESHRSLATTAALIHGAGKVELLLLLLLLLDIVLVDGAGEVELLLLLLFDIEDGTGEVELLLLLLFYNVCAVEPLKLTTTPTPT